MLVVSILVEEEEVLVVVDLHRSVVDWTSEDLVVVVFVMLLHLSLGIVQMELVFVWRYWIYLGLELMGIAVISILCLTGWQMASLTILSLFFYPSSWKVYYFGSYLNELAAKFFARL